MKLEKDVVENKPDDKELVVIDYYDRINKKWIKVETTREVARYIENDNKRYRRSMNKHNFHCLPLNEDFDSEENEESLIDKENLTYEQEEELKLELAEFEQKRHIIEQSLFILTPDQRETIEMVFYKNMSYSEIAKARGLNKSTVAVTLHRAIKNIKKHIQNTQN